MAESQFALYLDPEATEANGRRPVYAVLRLGTDTAVGLIELGPDTYWRVTGDPGAGQWFFPNDAARHLMTTAPKEP